MLKTSNFSPHGDVFFSCCVQLQISRDSRGQIELNHGFHFTWSGRIEGKFERVIAIIAIRIKAVKKRKETREVRDRGKTGLADYQS